MSGVKEMKVEIYSKSNCPFCEKAKAWFNQHGYTFTEHKQETFWWFDGVL